MIPKIIHYAWFGGNPLGELEEKCLESWKKYCPDWEIMRWDESNLIQKSMEFTLSKHTNEKNGRLCQMWLVYMP